MSGLQPAAGGGHGPVNSYRNPRATWLGSPNFTPDRDGHDMTQPSWVVLHTMVGTEAAADARFQQPSEQASATYGVRLDGTVVQWVDERDAAWANGATGRGGKGDNLDSISIEHEDNGDFNGPRTPELYAASAALVREVCTRYAIPIDRAHVIGHRECDFAQTACPDGLDLNRIVLQANMEEDMTPQEHDALIAVQREVGYVTDQSDPNYGKLTPNGVADVALSGIRALASTLAQLMSMVQASAPGQDAAAIAALKQELDDLGTKIDAKFAGLKLDETS